MNSIQKDLEPFLNKMGVRTDMKKKIGDLTLREIANMKCPGCNSCPFGNYDNDILANKCCELVDNSDEFHLLDQEIEVEENE